MTVPVILGVATLVFSLIHLVPGDPAQSMLGESAAPSDVNELRTKLGLNRPVGVWMRFEELATLGKTFTRTRCQRSPVKRRRARIVVSGEIIGGLVEGFDEYATTVCGAGPYDHMSAISSRVGVEMRGIEGFQRNRAAILMTHAVIIT